MSKKENFLTSFVDFVSIILITISFLFLMWCFVELSTSLTNLDKKIIIEQVNFTPYDIENKEEIKKYINNIIEEHNLSSTNLYLKLLTLTNAFIPATFTIAGGAFWIFRKEIINRIEKPIIDDVEKLNEKSKQKFEIQYQELKEELEIGRKAISLCKRQLYRTNDSSEKVLKATILEAPIAIRASIFYDTREFFLRNFRERENIDIGINILFRCIPIFEALSICDTNESIFHQSKAYLAYSIIYSEYPDFSLETMNKSIFFLSKAIEERNIAGSLESDFYWYEFKKAIYYIQKNEIARKRPNHKLIPNNEIIENLIIAYDKNETLKEVINKILDICEFNISKNKEISIEDFEIENSEIKKPDIDKNYFPKNYVTIEEKTSLVKWFEEDGINRLSRFTKGKTVNSNI